jgi:phage virion morphogenesis protein
MSGVQISATIEGLGAPGAAFDRMKALGENPRPIWSAIAQYGEASTRMRFRDQKGPDGAAWRPSRRALRTGSKTLIDRARLYRSITHLSGATYGEWGSNVIYAGIHQHGGKITRLAHSSMLRLRTDRAGRLLRQGNHANLAMFAKATHKRATERRYTVGEHTITMPARPYLGVNDADGREILALTDAAVDQVAANRGVK